MSAFDKIFMLSVIHDIKIESLEGTLKIPDIYDRYAREEVVVLCELERIALYFNIPVSFFFLDGRDFREEITKWVNLMALRVNKGIGFWTEKMMDAMSKDEAYYPPDDNYVHEFTFHTFSDIKLKFIVEGLKKGDKFEVSYTLGYQYKDEELIEYPETSNMEMLYKELLIYIDETDFFEDYCEE